MQSHCPDSCLTLSPILLHQSKRCSKNRESRTINEFEMIVALLRRSSQIIPRASTELFPEDFWRVVFFCVFPRRHDLILVTGMRCTESPNKRSDQMDDTCVKIVQNCLPGRDWTPWRTAPVLDRIPKPTGAGFLSRNSTWTGESWSPISSKLEGVSLLLGRLLLT